MTRARSEVPAIIAMVLLTNPAQVTGSVAPAMVSDFTERFHFSLHEASTLISAELGGTTVAIVLSYWLVTRFDGRLLAGLAILIAVAGQLATLAAPPINFVLAARTAVGFGGGIVNSVAIAAIAGTRRPDRNFGFVMASNTIAVTLILTLVAFFSFGVTAGRTMIALSLLLVLAAVVLPWLPGRAQIVKAGNVHAGRPAHFSLASALIGLLGMFFLATSFGSVWPSIGQIGLQRGDTAQTISTAFALAGFGGIAAGFIAASISGHLPRSALMSIGALGFAAAAFALNLPLTLPVIAAAAMFFWVFGLPFYFGTMASLDPSGKLAVLTTAMLPLGVAAGQLVTATLTALPGYAWIIGAAVIFAVAGLAALVGALGLHSASILRRSRVA
jgi:predicted MFS family arabinose efflux permease